MLRLVSINKVTRNTAGLSGESFPFFAIGGRHGFLQKIRPLPDVYEVRIARLRRGTTFALTLDPSGRASTLGLTLDPFGTASTLGLSFGVRRGCSLLLSLGS